MTKKENGRDQAAKMAAAIDDQPKPQHGSGSVFKSGTKTSEYDDLPKMKTKSYEDITAFSVLEIPKNQVKPVNQRIFCISQDPGEQKTEHGIIIPNQHNKPESKGGRKRERRRYWVVDVADDVTLEVPLFPGSKERRPLERGDEVYPFIPEEAEAWDFVMVYDFYTNKEYIVFHQTELGGVGMSPSVKKEKD